MNIFKENEDYLKDVTMNSVLKADKEFFSIMKEIRLHLGKKQYWLDNYVGNTLEAINHHLAYDSADAGFMEFGNLRRICTAILDGCGDTEHPIFSIAKEAIDRYRVKFQEHETLRSLAAVIAFPEYMKFTVQKFIQDESAELGASVDNIKQQELYTNMSTIVGEREMERLNCALKHRFLIVPAVEVFLQGMTNDYLYCFLHRDKETSQKVFQLLLDEDLESQGGGVVESFY